MKAIVSVIGKDNLGIIAKVSNSLFENGANILDISQTVMQDFFSMIMLVEPQKGGKSITELSDILNKLGENLGVEIRIQHEDIFNAMHRI